LRYATFRHEAVKSVDKLDLRPGETVESVEWDSDTDYFHIILKSEGNDDRRGGSR
jgi:hypothetical protein